MYVVKAVIIAAAKDLYTRMYYWRQTLREILIPVAAVLFLNLTAFPKEDPPPSEFMHGGVFKSCHHEGAGVFMTVRYEPKNNFTDALMSQVKCVGGFDVRAGDVEKEKFTSNVGVMLKGTDSDNSGIPDSLDYEVFSGANEWLGAGDLWWEETVDMQSYAYGTLAQFFKVIHAVDESFLQLKNIRTPEMSFQSMDMIGRSLRMHKLFILIAFFLGFSFMVPAVVGRLVGEKRSGVKELVLMMGLKKWHLWAAKLFDCIFLSGTSILLVLIFLYVPLTEESQVLTALPFSVLGSHLYLGLFGVFVFLCFMSCLFDSLVLATFIAQVVWFASFVLFLFMCTFSREVSFTFWVICCLVPHFSFFTGLSILLDFDYYGKEFRPGEILSVDPNYPTYDDVTFMMIFGILFYSAAGLYLEEVIPGKFGIRKPYNFFLKKSYWYPSRVECEKNMNSAAEDTVRNVDFESVPDGTNVAISVRDLRKEYLKASSQRPVAAVDGVSIDFYSGEICALLGHNGAGKTSLFSAISGLTHATSGRIFIDGYDVAENTNEARRSFGYCPQRDMLFEELTVFDNLRFFAMAKGTGVRDAAEEAHKFLAKLNLSDVERRFVRGLPRGQRRKLSLGIALIGESDVVLLDEPTCGLDAEERREIWEMLLSFKGTKTILLTTHSTEEADALSDRIAIMEHGKIRCYGTPMYLKSKYGSGYSLSVVIKNAEMAEGLTQFIQTFVKTARLTRENVSTLTYELAEEETVNFPMVFAGLDEMRDSGEIESYSVNFSSMEDVLFSLRRNESEVDRVVTVDHSPYKRLDCSDEVHATKTDSCFLLPFLQFYALIVKKCIYFSRNVRSYLMFSIIAVLLVVTSCVIIPAVAKDGEGDAGQPRRNFTYSLELYGKSAVPYSIASENELSTSFAEYVAKHGWETRRVGNVEKELQKLFREDFYAYTRETLMAIEFKGDKVKIYYNAYAVHMLPLAVNVFYDSILLANNVSGEIKTSVNEMYSGKEKKHISNLFIRDLGIKLPACSISDAPDFIGIQALFYLIGPMRERLFGAKNLQLMTTCGTLYWFAHLIFDCATFAVYLLVPALTIGFSTDDDMFFQNKEEIFFGMVLWGIALILLAYVLSSVTKSLGLASAAFLALYLTGTFVVYYPVKWKVWAKGFQYFHPSCILKMGLSGACAKEEGNHYWTALIIYSIVLFAFLVVRDSHVARDLLHGCYSRIVRVRFEEPARKDANVKVQEELVKELTKCGDYSGNSLIVDGLKRWRYKQRRPSPTVNGISFAVKSGECFGLLGVNGAGKTTSFKMMTGGMAATGGHVFVNGYNLFSPIEKRRGLLEIGYCPQYGGFIPTLTGKELLALFARLRGIRECDVSREATKWVEELDLTEYADTPVENYSGGNERKLSTGIAVIGSPAVIFLDEPTSGVDPVSRRNLWRIVNNLRAEGKCILFTSHSMDECEAICTRLAVMVKGSFRCFGEITTLKDMFGQGYAVRLKMREGTATNEFAAIKEAMSNELDPGCDLIDEHLTVLQYHVTNRRMKWDMLFSKLIRLKEKFDALESFHASAMTLEQIFISLARNEED